MCRDSGISQIQMEDKRQLSKNRRPLAVQAKYVRLIVHFVAPQNVVDHVIQYILPPPPPNSVRAK